MNKRWNEISLLLNDDQMCACFDAITSDQGILAVRVVREVTKCSFNDGQLYVSAIRGFLNSAPMSGELVSGLAELVGE